MAIYSIPKCKVTYFLSKEDINSVDELSNVSLKLNKLNSLLEISASEYDARHSVCARLQEMLKTYYPECQLLAFGTTTNGFGLKYSDLNILFLPFPSYCNLDYISNDNESHIPHPTAILNGNISRDVLMKLDESSHLKFVLSVLKSKNPLVKRVHIIPSTDGPVLNAHLTYGPVSNICVSNRLVIYNSELLQLFEKLDDRIKPLVITLRYWARSLGLLNQHYFNGYAFTLMVIFFLQNTNPPVLPSVRHLFEISGFSRVVAGWETAFVTDVNLIPKSTNTESTEELLISFFQFYWNFDFVQNIVSPYNGTVLPIKDLKDTQSDFELASINIQDPFVLSCNVFKKNIPVNIFKMELFLASQMLLDKSGKFKFSMLFDISEYNKIFKLQFERYVTDEDKAFFINLNHAYLNKLGIDSQIWCQKAYRTVFDVLQYGLIMECEDREIFPMNSEDPSLPKDMGMKNEAPVINLFETSNMKNVPFALELLASLQCTMYARIWCGRKKITEEDLEQYDHPAKKVCSDIPVNPYLQSEHDISKLLFVRDEESHSNPALLCFKCECYKHCSPQIADLVVVLKTINCSKNFKQVKEFYSFLQSFVPKTVSKILSSD